MVAVSDMTLEGEFPGVVTLLNSQLRRRGNDAPSWECDIRHLEIQGRSLDSEY